MLKNNIESFNRRDFLKLKFFLMFYTYFLQFFGVNLLADDNVSKINYNILDKLLEIPFSQEVKDEIVLRVELQKRYCYDSNGQVQSLNRFLKETINFIVSRADFTDFKLLNSIKDDQLDYGYMLNSTAKHNQVNSMKYIQQKLLSGSSNDMLNDAMLYAVKSNSIETTLHLMQQKIKLSDITISESISYFKREENEIFYKTISAVDESKLLPYLGECKKTKKRRMPKIHSAKLSYDYVSVTNLRDIAHNSLVDMYNLYYIDDFTAEISNDKLYMKVWNHSDIYIVDFYIELEKILHNNGFENFKDELASQEDYDIHFEQSFYAQQHRYIDYNDFINIDVL